MASFKQGSVVFTEKATPVAPSNPGEISVVARGGELFMYDGVTETILGGVTGLGSAAYEDVATDIPVTSISVLSDIAPYTTITAGGNYSVDNLVTNGVLDIDDTGIPNPNEVYYIRNYSGAATPVLLYYRGVSYGGIPEGEIWKVTTDTMMGAIMEFVQVSKFNFGTATGTQLPKRNDPVFTKVDNLETYVSDNFVAKSGSTMTGSLKAPLMIIDDIWDSDPTLQFRKNDEYVSLISGKNDGITVNNSIGNIVMTINTSGASITSLAGNDGDLVTLDADGKLLASGTKISDFGTAAFKNTTADPVINEITAWNTSLPGTEITNSGNYRVIEADYLGIVDIIPETIPAPVPATLYINNPEPPYGSPIYVYFSGVLLATVENGEYLKVVHDGVTVTSSSLVSYFPATQASVTQLVKGDDPRILKINTIETDVNTLESQVNSINVVGGNSISVVESPSNTFTVSLSGCADPLPYVEAVTTAGQTIPTTSYTTILYGTIVSDPNSMVTSSGGDWYATAPQTGMYCISAGFSWSGTANSGDPSIMCLFVNNDDVNRFDERRSQVNGSWTMTTYGTIIRKIIAGQKIRVKCLQVTGGTVTMLTNAAENYITITYVGEI